MSNFHKIFNKKATEAEQRERLADFESSIVPSVWTDADTDRIVQYRIDKECLHLDDVDELTMD